MTDRTWLNQFGEDYAVPAMITKALKDTSWGNDIAPSFIHPDADQKKTHLVLFVDHPVKEMRETEGQRYTIFTTEADGTIGDRHHDLKTDDTELAIEAFHALHRKLNPTT